MGLRTGVAVALAFSASAGFAHGAPACRPFENLAANASSPAEASDWGIRLNDPSFKIIAGDPLRRGPLAEASVRITTGGGLVGDPPKVYHVTAVRRGGAWRIAYRTEILPNRGRPVWQRWRTRRMPEADGRELDAALADPCLWRAPRLLLPAARLRSGLYTHCVDAPSTRFEIRMGQRHWRGTHLCWIVGAPGRVRQILMHAAFGQDYGTSDDEFGGLLGRTRDTIDPPRSPP